MAEHEQPTITSEQLQQVIKNAGYFQLLGVQVEIARPGVGHVHTHVDERLFHPQMIVHGGVIFTLADTAMSIALLSVLPPGTRISTIEAKINYLKPVRVGELLAEGTITHQGRSTAVTESTVYNIVEGERLLALVSSSTPLLPYSSRCSHGHLSLPGHCGLKPLHRPPFAPQTSTK